MVFLEYETVSGQVVQIHEIKPIVLDGYGHATTTLFKVGDEFEWTIWINEVDEEKNLLSHSAIRNNPNAKRLLQENEQLKETNTLLTSELAKVKIDLMLLKGGAS